jgi:hypothetical protein
LPGSLSTGLPGKMFPHGRANFSRQSRGSYPQVLGIPTGLTATASCTDTMVFHDTAADAVAVSVMIPENLNPQMPINMKLTYQPCR